MVGPPSDFVSGGGFLLSKGGRIEIKRLDIYDYFVGIYFEFGSFLFQQDIFPPVQINNVSGIPH